MMPTFLDPWGLASITSHKQGKRTPPRFRQGGKCSNCQGDLSIERLDGIASPPPDETHESAQRRIVP